MSYTIKVKDDASPMLKKLGEVLVSQEFRNALGRGASNAVQAFLFKLNSTRPNQMGGKRTNFWSASAKSTNYKADGNQITINISKLGYLQRVKGGEIKARNTKYLTIPATPEAYGKRAGEFSNLRFGFGENKYGNLMPALIKQSATRSRTGNAIKGKGAAAAQANIGNVMFWLTPRVFQRADPTVEPTEETVVAGAMRGADQYLRSRKDLK
jgi:hypothetical protein